MRQAVPDTVVGLGSVSVSDTRGLSRQRSALLSQARGHEEAIPLRPSAAARRETNRLDQMPNVLGVSMPRQSRWNDQAWPRPALSANAPRRRGRGDRRALPPPRSRWMQLADRPMCPTEHSCPERPLRPLNLAKGAGPFRSHRRSAAPASGTRSRTLAQARAGLRNARRRSRPSQGHSHGPGRACGP